MCCVSLIYNMSDKGQSLGRKMHHFAWSPCQWWYATIIDILISGQLRLTKLSHTRFRGVNIHFHTFPLGTASLVTLGWTHHFTNMPLSPQCYLHDSLNSLISSFSQNDRKMMTAMRELTAINLFRKLMELPLVLPCARVSSIALLKRSSNDLISVSMFGSQGRLVLSSSW